MPPSNDAYANRQVITGTAGSVAFDLTGATFESAEVTNNFPVSGNEGSVWYSFTAPTDGRYTFATSGTNTTSAAYLAMSTESATQANRIAHPGFGQEFLQFVGTSGVEYAIAVGGFTSPTITGTLTWSTEFPTYGEWVQDDDIVITSLPSSFVKVGAGHVGAGNGPAHDAYPSENASTRASVWSTALNLFNIASIFASSNAGTEALSAGDTQSWDNTSLVTPGASYNVDMYEAAVYLGDSALPGQVKGSTGLLMRADPQLPTVGADQSIEYDTTRPEAANTVVSIEVAFLLSPAAAAHEAFQLQMRQGSFQSVSETRTSVAALPVLYSHDFAAGDAAAVQMPWTDVTAAWQEVITGSQMSGRLGALVFTTDRQFLTLTPPDPTSAATTGTWANNVTITPGGDGDTTTWRVTLRPPRYRVVTWGAPTVVPPLRQYRRTDGLAGGPGRQTRSNSMQSSVRASWPGTYL